MSVIEGVFETKGTRVFFVDEATSSVPLIRQLGCPTGADNIMAGTKGRIDRTCLSETGQYRRYVGGFKEASELSIPFILAKGDDSHVALGALDQSNEVVGWLIGLSDSESVPTLDSNGVMVPPADRTNFYLEGYVASMSFTIGLDEIVRGTVSIQPSGPTVLVMAP